MNLPRSLAPWFRAGVNDDDHNTEPLSYRAWKRLGQVRGDIGWDADLVSRIADSDWDLLIILDACRHDTLVTVAEDAAVGRAVSPSTATRQFLNAVKEANVFAGTTYVSANPQSGKHSPGDVAEHVPVYEDAWDEGLQTVSPEAVYEIAEKRVRAGEQTVAHTIQPHYPHICDIDGSIRPVPNGLHPAVFDVEYDEHLKIQSLLSRGVVDLETARQSYRATTKFAWERARQVAAALADEGYTTVVTADHGELFGEWGYVEHPVNVPIRELVEVPWVTFEPTEATTGPSETSAEIEREDQLAALGYVE